MAAKRNILGVMGALVAKKLAKKAAIRKKPPKRRCPKVAIARATV
jgi:hypothetical protein